MPKPFDEALDDLIDKYVTDVADRDEVIDDIISALELKLMALKRAEKGDDRPHLKVGEGEYDHIALKAKLISEREANHKARVLSSLSPSPVGAEEPVAWRCRDEKWSQEYWHYFTKEPRHREPNEVWEPLYATPAAPVGVGDEAAKALEEAYVRGATWYRQNHKKSRPTDEPDQGPR